MSIRGSDVVVAFSAGALLGAVAGLLLAPASGAETRRRIGETAGSAVDKGKALASGAARKGREGVHAAGEFVKDQKERIGEALREGREAYRHPPRG
jgi:gas vesicle protein